MLRQLIVTHDDCPPTDFTTPPWKDALLVTPRHAVRLTRTQALGIMLIKCPAFDTVQGRQLTLEEKFAVAAKPKTGRGKNRHDRAGLADEVEVAVGMEVMVTFNVSTDLDVADRARSYVVEIVLDPREQMSTTTGQVYELQYPPTYVYPRAHAPNQGACA